MRDIVREKMRKQRRRDTLGEMLLRRELHAMGYRYRVDVRPEKSVPRRADIVFSKKRVAVFLDGCFWHACPIHASLPIQNGTWWKQKLMRNRTRDVETTELLGEKGWTVLRFWEHEDPLRAAKIVVGALRRASMEGG